MARGDGRIEPGQRLNRAISARAWNRAQEAADLVLGTNGRVAPGQPSLSPFHVTAVLVRNDSGQPVPACGVLAVSGVVFDPDNGTLTGTDAASSRAKQLLKSPVLTGIAPTNLTVSNVFVALEPVAENAIGRFACGGVFLCNVNLTVAGHTHARGRVGDVTQLTSTNCGPIRLLWIDTTAGNDRWAIGTM